VEVERDRGATGSGGGCCAAGRRGTGMTVAGTACVAVGSPCGTRDLAGSRHAQQTLRTTHRTDVSSMR
jgi:hypothetical protein